MAVASRHRIHIPGCSPYGFRLVGGDGQPVVVTKLRTKSKAAIAGVTEGDIVLAVNGRSCDDVTHDRLISLVEHAGHYLDLDIQRSIDTRHSHSCSSYNINNNCQVKPKSHQQLRSETCLGSRDLWPSFNNKQQYSDSSTRQPTAAALGISLEGGWGGMSPWRHRQSLPTTTAARDVDKQQVSVTWNPDRSLTMSLDLFCDKENHSTPVVTAAPIRHRNESFLLINNSSLAAAAAQNVTAQHTWELPVPSPPAPHHPVLSKCTWQTNSIGPAAVKFGPLPDNVLKILTPASDVGSMDSLSPTGHNKKIFADSSFYDDPSHHYPTVEEQIKMARSVALSLTSPANQSARGQEMFLKRQQNSMRWTTTDDNDIVNTSKVELKLHDVHSDLDHDIYYNPAPWTTGPVKTLTTNYLPMPPAPTPPPLFLKHFTRSVEQPRSASGCSTGLNGELDTVAPQVCFSLAAELKQVKDKGGRMFAKRRAKADQWTVENKQTTDASAGTRLTAVYSDEIPVRRARMSPWDAAVSDGNVERAFEHFNDNSVFRTTLGLNYPTTMRTSVVGSGRS